MSAGLSLLVQRQFPSPYRYDERHELRVIAEPVTFEGLVDAAFNQIRQYGKQDVAVIIRLLEAIATIADYTCDRKDRAVLLRHAAAIKRDSYENVSDKLDKQDIDEQYLVVEKALRSG